MPNEAWKQASSIGPTNRRPPDLRKNINSAISGSMNWLTSPLIGKNYSAEELTQQPSKIMSPERVMGMASSPLAIAGMMGGMGGMLSRRPAMIPAPSQVGMRLNNPAPTMPSQPNIPQPLMADLARSGVSPSQALLDDAMRMAVQQRMGPQNTTFPLQFHTDPQFTSYLNNSMFTRR